MLGSLFAADDPDTIVERSLEELRLKTEAHTRAWGLGTAARWHADLEAGTLSFTWGDGTIASGAVQVIGTYSTTSGTWLWGWDHPSVSAALAQDALKARAFRARHHLSAYTTRKIACTERDA